MLHGEGFEEATAHARGLEEREGLTFVHPYDDPAIIAGQGTVGIEMLEAYPDLEVMVIPIGGGGLISGIAPLRPSISTRRSRLSASRRPSTPRSTVWCGACRCRRILAGPPWPRASRSRHRASSTLPVIEELVRDILLVGEEDIEAAMMRLLETEKIVVEGAGAAALAAVLLQRGRFASRRVGVVVSGGNIDMRLLSSVILRGLARGGRLARLRVAITDQPGLLAKVANLIGEGGGNIVEVYHRRAFSRLSAKSAELDVIVETRGSEHVREIVNRLMATGYTVSVLSAAEGTDSL